MPIDATTARFLEDFGGEVVHPDDQGFAAARAAAVWNGDITRQPALIARPRTAAEVAAAVTAARRSGLDLTVRGGGHSAPGNCVADRALMIDLSSLDGVSVDPAARRATVGGGASWAPVDAATTAHGLAVVGGTVSHTGVAGLTLGGGMGWLTRRQGLSCDNLLQATVVTADGRIVTASEREHPDLFWGLRGAGANFGVVTEFVFALSETDPMADLGLFFWAVEDAREPLRAVREYLTDLPASLGALMAGLAVPAAPFIPAEHHGRTALGVMVAGWGNPEAHAAAVAPLRDLHPLVEFTTPIPYTALQQMLDDTSHWGVHAYEKGLDLDDLPDGAVDALLEWLPRKTAVDSFVPVVPLGGRYAEIPDDATAYTGRRSARWALSAVAQTEDTATMAADREWARATWQALRPFAGSDRAYVNFLGEADEARVRAAYGEEKYRRLAALKAEWDPDNVFRHNANIPPAPVSLPSPRGATSPGVTAPTP
ncbi:FAD-binding oxidoreductase [Geodermatophilus sp. SYSU D00697]